MSKIADDFFKVQCYTDIIKSLTYRKPLEQLFRVLFVFGGGFVQNTIKEEEAYYNKYERDPSTYKRYGRL